MSGAHASIMETIRTSWGWVGLQPKEVVATNLFGHVIVRDDQERFWRLCPEELSCVIIAQTPRDFEALSQNSEFQTDWQMRRLVDLASSQLGPLQENRCYCLKLSAVLGGRYELANLATITLDELIRFSAYLAEQIKDLPDGALVKFVVNNSARLCDHTAGASP